MDEGWQKGVTGQGLRALRKTFGWTQGRPAFKLGLKTEDSVYKKERGLRRITRAAKGSGVRRANRFGRALRSLSPPYTPSSL